MFQRLIRVLKFDSQVFEEVEHDPSATGQAALVVVLMSIVGSLGAVFFGDGGLKLALGLAVSGLVTWAVMAFLSLFIGKALGGTADSGELLRALGFAYAPAVYGIIPFIGGPIAWIVGLITWVIALRQALDVSTGKAVGVAILVWLARLVITALVLVPLGVTSAVMGGGPG